MSITLETVFATVCSLQFIHCNMLYVAGRLHTERRRCVLCCRLAPTAVYEILRKRRVCQLQISERFPQTIRAYHEEKQVLLYPFIHFYCFRPTVWRLKNASDHTKPLTSCHLLHLSWPHIPYASLSYLELRPQCKFVHKGDNSWYNKFYSRVYAFSSVNYNQHTYIA